MRSCGSFSSSMPRKSAATEICSALYCRQSCVRRLRAQAARGAAPPRSARARGRRASRGDAGQDVQTRGRTARFRPSWLSDAHGNLRRTGPRAARRASHQAQPPAPGLRSRPRLWKRARRRVPLPARPAHSNPTRPYPTLPYTPWRARLSSSRFQAVCGSMEWPVAGWCGGPFFRR